MSSPSKKYATVLSIIAAALVIVGLVGLLFPLRDGPAFWLFTYLPYAASAALLLTIPVSLIWMIFAATKKKWGVVGHLAVATIAPLLGFAGAIAATWRIARELFPA
ncbi:MAG: hypothetical protein KF715_21275 [Candidatus Didemnitutus sp.]|nr:hypothetical protein [Candidatus Didemnitutus sp.]